MPSRRPASSSRRRGAGGPPPGLFPAREDLLRLLAVLSIAAAAAAACSLLNRRPEPFCDSLQAPDDYADGDSCQPCPHNGRCVDGCYISISYCNLFPGFQFQKHDISDTLDDILSNNPGGLTQDGIELVKARVLESAQAFFETTFTSNKAEAFKCPELVAERHMPLTCQARQWISRNIIFVTTFCILFAALLWILWIIYWRQALSTRAEQIYEQVCEILEDNALNAKIDNSDCEPWVVASWLRDHLLVPRERKNAFLWEKVEELILEDSRIDQYPKVIKGESKVVYEWQASCSLSAKSKRGQGARAKLRTGAGAIKLGEEIGGCRSEVSEQGSCDLTCRVRTEA